MWRDFRLKASNETEDYTCDRSDIQGVPQKMSFSGFLALTFCSKITPCLFTDMGHSPDCSIHLYNLINNFIFLIIQHRWKLNTKY